MSASSMARQATTCHTTIPTRRVVINHENEMPSEYGTTPGGTLFGTTPGGTRIIYDRTFLLQMRNSPLARTPPANLPVIPGVTSVGPADKLSPNRATASDQHNGMDMPQKLQTVKESAKEDDDQFDMDI